MDKEKQIGFQVKELSKSIKKCIEARIVKAHIGQREQLGEITYMQGWILGYIYHHMQEGDVFQRDIEKTFHIRRSTVAGILQLMEKKGLIERESAAQDARMKKLILTPKAMVIHEETHREIEAVEKRMIKGMSEGEILLFKELICKMKANLEEAEKEIEDTSEKIEN